VGFLTLNKGGSLFLAFNLFRRYRVYLLAAKGAVQNEFSSLRNFFSLCRHLYWFFSGCFSSSILDAAVDISSGFEASVLL
jgi:hypothetical protein